MFEEAQSQLQSDPLNFDAQSIEKEASVNLRKWHHIEDCALKQKAKVHWCKEAD